MPTRSPENAFGIDAEWLIANVAEAIRRDLPQNRQRHSPDQLRLFRTTFLDPSLIGELAHLGGGGFDDYPEVQIEVLGQSGRRTMLTSVSQQQFMLPWLVDDSGEQFVINNRSIGDALYRLLPKGFPNRERIGGKYLRAAYSEAVLDHIRQQWDMADSIAVLGPLVQEIGGRFELIESKIVSISSIDTEGHGWWGKLRFPDSVLRGRIGFFFPMIRNQPPSLAEFYARIDGLVQRLRSVSWLTEYLTAHIDTQVELRFVGEHSLGDQVATMVVTDLREHGKFSLANRVDQERTSCAFIEIQDGPGRWSRWLLFSNGDMLLWVSGSGSALGYSRGNQAFWESSGSSGWKGIGIVIHPEGVVLEDPAL